MSIAAAVRNLGRRLSAVVLPVALALTAVVAVVLARQNADLTLSVRRLRGQQRLPHVHDVMPEVRAPTLDGRNVTLGAGPDKVQVLFMFNTTCHYCAENLGKWQMNAKALAPTAGIGVYAVSLDPDSATRAYVEKNHLTVPVARFPDHRSAGTYRVIGVPVTLVMDSTGLVLYERASVLTMPAVDSLFDVLRQAKLIPAARAAAPAPTT
jgi:peroxiredoxin